MANTIAQIASNFASGNDKFTDVEASNVVGTWRVNIPYATYTGEE
jgi:methyl-galactoside transport system substrate-binding protein